MTSKTTHFRSFIALLVCLLMLIGTVAGCSGKQDAAVSATDAAYEEMDRFQ